MAVDVSGQTESGATQTSVSGAQVAAEGTPGVTPSTEGAGIFAPSGEQQSGAEGTPAGTETGGAPTPEGVKAGESASDVQGTSEDGGTESALGAPEAYTFEAVEGTELDENVSTKFAEVARSLNLSQTAAQKILTEMSPVMAQRTAENQKAQIDAFLDKTVAEWAAARDSDPEVGGVGLQANLVLANKALKQFGTPALEKLLSENRLHNHPEIARLLYRVGKAIEPDGAPFDGRAMSDTKPGATPTEAAAQKLYG